ncbi:MAG: flagellar hook-basal body protein [Butyrivibrio sp.]
MMRSLYTAASGMIAQQTNVDVISNNLANVNSTGYKTSTAEFKSLLYQTLQSRSTSANGDYKPIGAQVGTGARTASITTDFSQGAAQATSNNFGFAIEGEGLFAVQGANGETYYTRNGNFQMAVSVDGFMLCTQEGYPVLDSDGMTIEFDSSYTTSKITATSDGTLCYPDENNNLQSLGIRIGVYQVTNPAGMESVGSTMYKVTAASGEAVEETANPELKRSKLMQGYLEASNVNVADEMVNLIVAQRAYEMNSKAIQTSDDMLGQANQLKR